MSNPRPDRDTRERLWAEAMRAGRNGDGPAYERLLGEVAALLRLFIARRLARMGLDTQEAEDLVQEVLIGLHTKRHSWDGRRPFLPWLYAIAGYKLTDGARRLRREAARHLDVSPEALADVFEAPEADMDRHMLDLAPLLARLPLRQQHVVQALAVEGRSVRATAAALHTSEGAIRVTFQRALRRLAGSASLTGRGPGKARE